MAPRLKVAHAVWVAVGDEYRRGRVAALDDGGATIELPSALAASKTSVRVPHAECFPAHVGGDVPDHCQLTQLSGPTLLENSRARFTRDAIYTWAGSILGAWDAVPRLERSAHRRPPRRPPVSLTRCRTFDPRTHLQWPSTRSTRSATCTDQP